MQLEWITCTDGVCSFTNVNLADPHFNGTEGVYIIWNDLTGKVIRLGQGLISDRIASHRNDPSVTRHAPTKVIWARVPKAYRNGVERFLANHYKPIVGDAFPDCSPIACNLP